MAGGGKDLSHFQCPTCGEDTGSLAALYMQVARQCLARLGETMEEYKRKHKLQQKHLRYLEQGEERWTQAWQQVSHSPHIILGTFGQSSSILGQKFGGAIVEQE